MTQKIRDTFVISQCDPITNGGKNFLTFYQHPKKELEEVKKENLPNWLKTKRKVYTDGVDFYLITILKE